MGLMEFSKQVIKNLLSKPATSSYPFQPKQYPEASRGHIEIDIDSCIFCGMCQRKCMSGAITVDRATKTWSIERMGCVQGGDCTIGCPKSCLSIVPGYTQPATEKIVDSYSQPIPEPTEAEEGVLTSGKIVNDMSKCIACGLCARKCPQGCITTDVKAKVWTINRDECIQCGECINACIKFKALSFGEDDGEKGVVTLTK